MHYRHESLQSIKSDFRSHVVGLTTSSTVGNPVAVFADLIHLFNKVGINAFKACKHTMETAIVD